jgi:Amt family ammonium transporter
VTAILLTATQVWGAEGAAEPLTWEQYRDQLGITDAASVEASPMGSKGGYSVDALWTVIAAILVFWMQAGFALVEAGFTRAKNVVNILMKNLMDFSLGSIVFWAFGFGLMFGVSNGFMGTTGFFLQGYSSETWTYTFLLFQTVFAATAATIVSGAMAERTKFISYLLYSAVLTGLIYPIFGSWAWGGLFDGGGWLEAPDGGFLAKLELPGFIDFAGSTVVHSIGGWAALAGAIVLGPRLGKFKEGAAPIRGHSMTLATLGVFILWMGWFGFNAGSTTGVTGGAEPTAGAGKAFGLIAVNTNLAACSGALLAMVTTWARAGKPEISMALNGALSGLVAITAPCATVTPLAAIIIGAAAGVLVVFSVEFFENRKVDDPVGAISVHGVCGAWGTLSAALFHVDGFSSKQLITQAIGVGAAFVWAFSLGLLLFFVVKKTIGLRVSEEDEIDGLDLSEHGGEAYPIDDDEAWGGEDEAAAPAYAAE